MSDTARDQALAQVANIYNMVQALDVDYSRLEELKDRKEENLKTIAQYQEKMDDWQANADALSELEELAELENQAGDCESEDDARERIEEDPLSIEIRSDWVNPGEELTPCEFRIVLCTGGPHVEIVGDLNQYSEPTSCRVIYKDWGDRGELYDFDHAIVLRYCQCFYFGG